MNTYKFLIGATLFFVTLAHSQIAVNVNIGSRPAPAPVVYSTTEYYYIPEAQAYYDVRESNYIYNTNRRWIRARHLPVRYKYYETYHANRVIIHDYHGPSPYLHHKAHHAKYFRNHGHKPTFKQFYNKGERYHKVKKHSHKDRRHGRH